MGFAGGDRVVVRWEDTDRVWIACCEVKAKTLKPGTLVIGSLMPAANAISPDGRWFAGIGDIPDKSGVRIPQLALVDLTRAQSRVMPIIGVDPQAAGPPTALTFSGDGKRLAALYERNGALVLIGWRLPEARQLPTLAVPMGKVPPPAPGGVGRLASVLEGRAWLVGGNALLDPENGRLLGELGVAEAVSVSAYLDAVRLMYLEEGERQMLLVRLVPAAFAAATRPATKPAP